jgi:CRP-like cAMP-binding protein
VRCRIVPFIPGRRPTDEDTRSGLGSSDSVALVTGEDRDNRTVLLFEVLDLAPNAVVEATITVADHPVAGWHRRSVSITRKARQRLELRPERDLADVDVGFTGGFMRKAQVELRVLSDGAVVAGDETSLDVCDVRNLGTLYKRLIDRLLIPDTSSQARRSRVANPGVTYHPWYPVLTIGGDKAALYRDALVADIVGKEYHLTDPAWLLRVGVYLELLTGIGIIEAIRPDVGDLLDSDERDAFETSNVFVEIRRRLNPEAWRGVWDRRHICFPAFGSPRLGPVSALNLMRKKDATLRFLHVHHEDLRQAIELAGPNDFNSQETWQRVFRDAERAVLRQTAHAFPELGFLPTPAKEVVLWQRLGFAGQQGVYPTACNQYRASMNAVADWAKARGLMDHAGPESVPREASLLEALVRDPPRVGVLQRQDGLGPRLTVTEPPRATGPTIVEIERLLSEVPIFRMLSADDVHKLALDVRPLLLGPTQRFVVEGREGTSLFLVGEGTIEVRLRKADGTDWLVETMGPGEVVGEMALLTGERRAATVRSVDESLVFEIGREQYEPLLRAHPEWLGELAVIMEERLARRQVRRAELDGGSRQTLLARITRNFFGGREPWLTPAPATPRLRRDPP